MDRPRPVRRSKRSWAIRDRLAEEKSSASFGHQAPDAPKPVIVWAAERTRMAGTAGASARAGAASPATATAATSAARAAGRRTARGWTVRRRVVRLVGWRWRKRGNWHRLPDANWNSVGLPA